MLAYNSTCVCWQHFPLDVALGLAAGFAIGSRVERSAAQGVMLRGWVKVVCGTVVTAVWGPMMLIPLCKRIVPSLSEGLVFCVHVCFYGCMLACRVPLSFEEADWWPGMCSAGSFWM